MYRFCYLPDKQKRLMAELMNFFVAMTKESHPCHVIIAASDAFFGLDHRFGHLPPGVETPGYYPPSLQDGKSPIGATDNSPAIYCRVVETVIKAPFSSNRFMWTASSLKPVNS